MDAKRMRPSPLFLETFVYGEVRRGGEWTDLRKLKYHHAGTRPGFIHMESDDGLVAIEITSRRNAALSPIFVKYSFSVPVDFRLSAQFKHPELIKETHSADEAGYSAFSTEWSEQDSLLEKTGAKARPGDPAPRQDPLNRQDRPRETNRIRPGKSCSASTPRKWQLSNGSESYAAGGSSCWEAPGQ